LEIEVFQKVAGLKNSHSTPPILEHPTLPLNLVLNTDIVIVLLLRLVALPHTFLGLDLEVEFGVAIHHRTLLDQTLEWTDFHRHSKRAVREEGKRASNFCFGGCGLLLLLGEFIDHRERLYRFL